MKILAMSDLHGNIPAFSLESVDVVCIAGDIAPTYGWNKWQLIRQNDWLKKNLLPWIEANPKTHFVAIPGNHDLCATRWDMKDDVITNIPFQFPSNMHFLRDSGVTINGKHFYGTPHVPIINYCWAFEGDNEKLKSYFSRIPKNVDVLLSHTPPALGHDIPIDCSLQYGGTTHFGSPALAQAIFEKEPKIVFCGHIHSGKHGKIEFGKTDIYNVSLLDEDYKMVYLPTEVNFV